MATYTYCGNSGNPSSSSSDIKRYKLIQNVDATFLSTPEITLQKSPITDAEVVSLNGLEIDNTNYIIVGDVLTMVTTQLEDGDIIYINFIG